MKRLLFTRYNVWRAEWGYMPWLHVTLTRYTSDCGYTFVCIVGGIGFGLKYWRAV